MKSRTLFEKQTFCYANRRDVYAFNNDYLSFFLQNNNWAAENYAQV